MQTNTLRVGTVEEVLKRWEECILSREKSSPLAACWYSELGELNKLVHLWPYADMAERYRIRVEASKDPNWTPSYGKFLVKMENKILMPQTSHTCDNNLNKAIPTPPRVREYQLVVGELHEPV